MNWVYFLGWAFFRLVYATYFRWRVFNPERVPLDGPVILAANHASFIDPPLVGGGLQRHINYLAREPSSGFPWSAGSCTAGRSCPSIATAAAPRA